jgi:hypothetical protein
MAKKKKGRNYNITSRYMKEKGTFGGIVEPAYPSAIISTPRPRYPRLAFRPATPKLDITASEVAARIKGTFLPRTLFFPDTNFFSRPMNFAVWDALLEKRIVITPKVWDELQPWIANPFYNVSVRDFVLHARGINDPRVEFLQVDNYEPYGYQYYYNLLSCRKRIGGEIYEELKAKLNRDPLDEEFRREVQVRCKERGYTLAIKGKTDEAKPNRFADEELVVLAVQTAIIRNADVVLLTRDADVQDQFSK